MTMTDIEANEPDGSTTTRYALRKRTGHRPASMEFPEDLYLRLQVQAAKEERSMAAVTRIAVAEYLDRAES